ncbi:MAG: hypothetical protein Q4D16_06625 [Eubacteriales bacterium]|nr:hypothetical protein [Eubacteriales bacterium]
MWSLSIGGVDFYHIINWFFIYSFLGWVWETCFVSFKKGEYVNRGFINGPFCTIYGFGAISVYLILKPVGGNILWLFFGGIVVATALEYVTAVLMESIFHTSWWDYSDKKFNFQGRICLGASLGWGFFTVMLFRVLHPMVEEIVGLYPVIAGEIGVCAVAVGYTADFCYSAATAFRLRERIPVWEQAIALTQGELFLKVKEKMDSLEQVKGLSLDSLKERLEDVEFLRELEEKRSSMMKEITKELQSRKEAAASMLGHNVKRYVKAYPNLNRGYRIHKEKRDKKKQERNKK